MENTTNITLLFEQLRKGDQVSLGRAITLIESKSETHRLQANELLEKCLPYSGNSKRIGITGVPGVGKSSVIEQLGTYYIEHKAKKVAVLAIDPSSSVSGGSILGDKTRMTKLASLPQAFIRPTPAGSVLGGIAERTKEAIIICEAAGYDIIMVETVGVGQSETKVKNLTDLVLLLMLPNAGDELQGIKRGIIEIADLIAVNKCDGALADKARETASMFKMAMHLLSGKENLPVLTLSILNPSSMIDLELKIATIFAKLQENDNLQSLRINQNLWWFNESLNHELLNALLKNATFKKDYQHITAQINKNQISPFKAVNTLILKYIPKL